jgi:hypothetical protein
VRPASMPQRRGSPDLPRRRPNVPRHRPKSEFSIDQCVWTAGSFPGDFRTPVGVRNSSRERNVSFKPALGRSRQADALSAQWDPADMAVTTCTIGLRIAQALVCYINLVNIMIHCLGHEMDADLAIRCYIDIFA